MMQRILLIDDAPEFHELVKAVVLAGTDTDVLSAFDGQGALAMLAQQRPDLIILDLTLPDIDGMELCRQFRADDRLAGTPILMLTARGETHAKYQGFLHGADDYLIKPFDPIELQLRIRALLRRSAPHPASAAPDPVTYRIGEFTLNPLRFSAEWQDLRIPLTHTEFTILNHLAQRPDRVVTVEDLLTHALEYPARTGNPQVIHTHMRNIREKFREAGHAAICLTSSRLGYLLESRPAPAIGDS